MKFEQFKAEIEKLFVEKFGKSYHRSEGIFHLIIK